MRGRFRQCLYCTEDTEGTRYDVRTAHVRGEMRHEFRTIQVRGEIKLELHTVREETMRLRTAQRARTQTCSWQNLPSGVGAVTRSQEHNTNRESSTTRSVS